VIKITWNVSKNSANLRKHGIAFEDAMTILTSGADYFAVFDVTHSTDEDRFIAIGPLAPYGVALVVWTELDEESIRLISARRATSKEKLLYYSFMEGTL
jgi:uncharacterized DUF497 family protein